MPNLIISKSCNLRCPYCFTQNFLNKKQAFITLQDFQKNLHFCAEYATIGLIGGEPLLHPQLDDIINICKINNFNIIIYTNGVYIHKHISSLLTTTLLVNVNSPNDIGQETFNIIEENCLLLKENNIPFTLGLNFYPDLKDYSFFLQLCQLLGVTDIRFSICAPISVINKEQYYTQNLEKVKQFFKECLRLGLIVHLDCNHIPACYFSFQELELFNNIVDWSNFCLPSLDIDFDGTVYSCFGTQLKDYLSSTHSLQQINNNFILKYKELSIFNNCNNCFKQQMQLCQGGCLAFSQFKME